MSGQKYRKFVFVYDNKTPLLIFPIPDRSLLNFVLALQCFAEHYSLQGDMQCVQAVEDKLELCHG